MFSFQAGDASFQQAPLEGHTLSTLLQLFLSFLGLAVGCRMTLGDGIFWLCNCLLSEGYEIDVSICFV